MAETEPTYLAMMTDFDLGQCAAFLQVSSFIAHHGKKEVDAFCMQALADMQADAEHADRQRRAGDNKRRNTPLQSNTLEGNPNG